MNHFQINRIFQANFLNLKDSNKINLEFVYLTVDQMIKIYDDIFHVAVYIRNNRDFKIIKEKKDHNMQIRKVI